MKGVPLKEFRRCLARRIRGADPVLITNLSSPVARLLPVRKPHILWQALSGLCGLGHSIKPYLVDEVAYNADPDR